MIDRKNAPAFKIPENLFYIPPIQQKMPNGAKLYSIKAGTQDVMRFVMVFEAGTRFQSQSFVASATFNMLSEGTQHFTSSEIAEKFDFYGSSFEVSIDRDWAIVSIYCLTKYCDETLQLVEELIKRPVFPEKELETYKQKHKETLRIEQEKVKFIAHRAFLETIYGANHPYGSSGKVSDYDMLNRDLLVDYHSKHISSANVFMILAGNIGEREQAIAERYFGVESWGNQSLSGGNWSNPVKQADKYIHIPKDGTLQSAVRVGRVLFTKNHPDNIGMQVLNTVLGGYFGSRLMRNIREDKGYTYGIYSIIVPQKKSGYLSIVTETGVEYTSAVLTEIEKEIHCLQTELVPSSELNLVKQYIFGEMMRTLDGPWGLSEVCLDNIQSGLPDNYVEMLFNEVRDITSEQLLQLAIKYLNSDDLYRVVAG